MQVLKKIRTLVNYTDWLDKAIFNFERYQETKGVYDMADCFLTLNAIPEWIVKSIEAPGALKELATKKLVIMRGHDGFVFDENQIGNIDHKLRFIRMFCNHSKHGEAKDKFPRISMSTKLPARFPIAFTYISIGDDHFNAEEILNAVISFWQEQLQANPIQPVVQTPIPQARSGLFNFGEHEINDTPTSSPDDTPTSSL